MPAVLAALAVSGPVLDRFVAGLGGSCHMGGVLVVHPCAVRAVLAAVLGVVMLDRHRSSSVCQPPHTGGYIVNCLLRPRRR